MTTSTKTTPVRTKEQTLSAKIETLADLDLQMSILKDKFEAAKEEVKQSLKDIGIDDYTRILDNGEKYKVAITMRQNPGRLDKEALEAEFGKDRISKFIKPPSTPFSEVFTCRVVK